MAEDKAAAKGAKTRRPSAQKRDIQGEKRRLRNRSYRAEVLTAIRTFEASITKKEAPEAVKTKLGEIYSLMDKGVKRGVYKAQKASRTKSRLTARLASL
ncbi:MAG: 30S ribosomal protein S20 [Verrucomicrobia bacterium]|nr:30S ribosomal protein S20 [Verrucomicrobiota bacterium]